jgi:hypothetical protein
MASLGFTPSELKKIEKWAYWRVRVRREKLCLENSLGTRYEVVHASADGVGPEAFNITEYPSGNINGIPVASQVPLSDIEWVPSGLKLKSLNSIIDVNRLFWVKK